MGELDRPASDLKAKLLIAAGSVAATGLLLWLALMLGSWGYQTRRYLAHEGRLQRLVAKEPTLAQVEAGLAEEGAALFVAPRSDAELRQLAARFEGPRGAEIVRKGKAWRQTRAYLAGDMVYVLYFDAGGIVRDFTCLSR